MKNTIPTILLLCGAIGLLFQGCGIFRSSSSNELTKVVKRYGYVPFNAPRDKDGVGTLITFQDKHEAVVATAEECFDISTLNIDTLSAELEEYEYTISTSDTASFTPGELFGSHVNLNAALGFKNVRRIKVSFGDLFVVRVSRLSVENNLARLKQDNLPCLKRLVHKDNFFIERVLGSKSMTVTLLNDRGQIVNVDADIMDQINIGNQFVRSLNGYNKLAYNEPRLIGYRLWQVRSQAGAVDTETSIENTSEESILDLKM